jgi:hypothetical protein
LALALLRPKLDPDPHGIEDYFWSRLAALPRGAAKTKINGPPARTFAIYICDLPSYLPNFLFRFFWYVFRRFLVKGELKNTIQIFLQKVPVENDPKIDVSFTSL